MDREELRNLPSVDELVNVPALDRFKQQLSRPVVTAVTRVVLAEIRADLSRGEGGISNKEIETTLTKRLREFDRRRITRVINGTGVLIHTNLGRAPLGRELLRRICDRVGGYSTLEFDLNKGKRGTRGAFLSDLFALLTGSESALAVNNNAAALFLILNAFANRKEVIVSRSELVQIGGGFRIPDIIKRAGSKLVEVGTTNKVTLADYKDAITPRTRILLKVHQSNFKISGFVEEVDAKKLALLASERNLTSVYDLGSGSYHQTEKFGMEREPNIFSALKTGSDLVCFSGDKLLAASQAGIILGSNENIRKLHRNPIYRTLRLDKLTLAVLEEAAFAYLREEEKDLLPLWGMIAASKESLRKRAEKVREKLKAKLEVSVEPFQSTPGGGSLPGGSIESVAITVSPSSTPTTFQKKLLAAEIPVVGVVKDDRFWIDFRTVDESEDEELIQQLLSVK